MSVDAITPHKSTPTPSASRTRHRRSPIPHLDHWETGKEVGWSRTSVLWEVRPGSAPHDAPFDYVAKLLRSDLENDTATVHRFRREAAIGHRINHPHVMSVLSASVAAAPFYFVMPRVTGTDLAERLETGPTIAPAQALWIARQVTDGLSALHDIGWMHGDIQPANVLLACNGHATLCDLGLASSVDQAHLLSDQRLTGMLSYIAPEMLTSRWRATAASDVYSLGVTLFEMLTGRRLCPSDDPARVAEFHLHGTPPHIRAWLPQAPHQLSHCLTAMLAKDPLRRPSTSGELQSLLTRLEIEMFALR